MRSPALLAVVAVLAIGLVGCGGGGGASTSAFKAGFKADRTQFRQLGTDLGKAITNAGSKTNAQLATELSSLSTRVNQQASKLAKLNPPSKYKPTLDKLVAGLKSVSADLKRISAAAAGNEVQAARSATRSLISHAAQVKATDVALSDGLGLPGPG